jgi:hypothetical protein
LGDQTSLNRLHTHLHPTQPTATINSHPKQKTNKQTKAALPPRFAPEGPAGLGTGYPHDEATKRWLAGSVDLVFGFPPIVQFSWETAARCAVGFM